MRYTHRIKFTMNFVKGFMAGQTFDDHFDSVPDAWEKHVAVLRGYTPEHPCHAIGGSDYFVTNIEVVTI